FVTARVNGVSAQLQRPLSAALSAAAAPVFSVRQLLLAITSPAPGAIVFAGDPISFAGTATDDASIALDPAFLTWSSSLSGPIGAGTSFSRSLTAGLHVITFKASNGSTLSGST